MAVDSSCVKHSRVGTYDYQLPKSLIAKYPPVKRGSSRMLVLERSSGKIHHAAFADFPYFLQPGDLVVLNDSKVIPARIFSSDGQVELLVLKQFSPLCWQCFVKPGSRMHKGALIPLEHTTAQVTEILPRGERILQLSSPIDLNIHGLIPLPPYINRPSNSLDTERYQTVFANSSGSIAAPTAGLHFYWEMLARIPHAFLTLHVGMWTFLPVKTEFIADHTMHEEYYHLPEKTAEAISQAKRTWAIGTTVARVLESQPTAYLRERSGTTRLFIHPPYQFTHVDCLLTNFHLPKSTLLMLVCAFGGLEAVLAAYQEAVREKYRFFSYGDCMLIL